jgi:hypothetical protein
MCNCPLAFRPEDDAGQIPPPGWRGWRTTITSTPQTPPQAEIGDAKPKQTKPRRKKPAT